MYVVSSCYVIITEHEQLRCLNTCHLINNEFCRGATILILFLNPDLTMVIVTHIKYLLSGKLVLTTNHPCHYVCLCYLHSLTGIVAMLKE